MTHRGDLRSAETHFAFGENWRSFLATVSDKAVEDATRDLAALLGGPPAAGTRFLDIGCGSGMSMLAALRLGFAEVEGVDIDDNSAAAARTLLGARAPGGPWSVRTASVFELDPARDGGREVVHSWGVLHHTGDMWPAIDRAAALVAPGGRLVLALYRKTPLCGFWRVEKRFYSRAPAPVRAAMRGVFKAMILAGITATGRNPWRYVRTYGSARGMDFHHDVVDWLGGYPYESVAPEELSAFLAARGFEMERMRAKTPAVWGVLGTHCDEFVAVRRR
jgi:2-polyprenyl-6-hydroxyphenyl methylase/3-demethylubiquinone-9 3-methyltransferase